MTTYARREIITRRVEYGIAATATAYSNSPT